jgi:CspA family cold shock protein
MGYMFVDSHSESNISSAVAGIVKWFNVEKGFGFVEPTDGRGDAFLHISVLEKLGHKELPQGIAVVCDLAESPKGWQVINIVDYDREKVAELVQPVEEKMMLGVVKFFNEDKGFGFVTPENGDADVYIGLRVLEKANLRTLERGQQVIMSMRSGRKGPMAESISLLGTIVEAPSVKDEPYVPSITYGIF